MKRINLSYASNYLENIASNEALMFQKKSAVGTDLEKMFQEAIDYKNSLPFNDQPKKVIDYCIKTMLPKFKEIIKKNLNLIVENIVVNKKPPKLSYAINCSTGNEDNIWIARTLSTGMKSYQNTDISKEIKEVLDLYKLIDPKTGKFLKTTYGEKNKPIFIVLYFDITMSFLLDHYVDPNLVPQLTARELTAIYLHELGHFYEMIEGFQNVYYVADMVTSHLINIVKNNHPIDIVNAIVDNKDSFVRFKGKDKELDKKIDTVLKVCEFVNYVSEFKDNNNSSSVSKLYLIIFLVVKCTILLLKSTLMSILVNVTINPLLELMCQISLKTINIPSGKLKSSDVYNTFKLMQKGEINADQYAVRSGYGPEQISALAKMDKFCSVYYLGRDLGSPWIFKGQQQNIDLINFMLGFYTEFYSFTYDVHETGIARLQHLLQQHIVALKSAPADLQVMYLDTYERALKELNNFKLGVSDNIEKISMFFNYILDSPSKFVSNILTGNMHQDYYKLQTQIEDICNNKLYYYGLKLQQLAK